MTDEEKLQRLKNAVQNHERNIARNVSSSSSDNEKYIALKNAVTNYESRKSVNDARQYVNDVIALDQRQKRTKFGDNNAAIYNKMKADLLTGRYEKTATNLLANNPDTPGNNALARGLYGAANYSSKISDDASRSIWANNNFSSQEEYDYYQKYINAMKSNSTDGKLDIDSISTSKEETNQNMKDLKKKLNDYRDTLSRIEAGEPIYEEYSYDEYDKLLAEYKKAADDYELIRNVYSNEVKPLKAQNYVSDIMNKSDFESNSDYRGTGEYDAISFVQRANEGYNPYETVYHLINGDESVKGLFQEEDLLKYTNMSDEQKKAFNYLYNTNGDIDSYLKAIKEDMNYNAAKQKYEDYYKDNPLHTEFFNGIGFGLSNALEGAEGLVRGIAGSEDYDITYNKYLQSMIGSNVSGINKLAFDAGVSTGNMIPSMAVGAVTANPVVGAVLMGSGAAGNAYNDAIREGRSVGEARTYGIINGALEGGLEYLLGGMPGISSGLVPKSIESILPKGVKAVFDKATKSAISKAVSMYGKDVFDEFKEEYLQEVLDPIVRNMVYKENNEVKLISADAIYAGVLGALTAGIMGAPNISIRTQYASALMEPDNKAALIKEALSLPEDSKPYMLASEKSAESMNKMDMLELSEAVGEYETEVYNESVKEVNKYISNAQKEYAAQLSTAYANIDKTTLKEFKNIAKSSMDETTAATHLALMYHNGQAYKAIENSPDVAKDNNNFAKAYESLGTSEISQEQAFNAWVSGYKNPINSSESSVYLKSLSKFMEEGKGTIRVANDEETKKYGIAPADLDNLSSKQKAAVSSFNLETKALGINTVWYDSRINGNTFDGMYKNGTVYLDVNAGYNNEQAILRAASHELTHFIQEYGEDSYLSLRDHIRNQISDIDWSKQIEKEKSKLNRQDYSSDELLEKAAEDEVIANACEMMLKNSDAINKLHEQDLSTFNVVKKWIDGVVTKLRNLVAKLRSKAWEGIEYSEDVVKLLDDWEETQRMWDEALVKASNKYNGTSENKLNIDNIQRHTKINAYVTSVGLKPYSEKEILYLEESHRIQFATSEADIADFVNKYKKTGEYRRILCGKLTKKLSDRIYNDTGVDVEDYNIEITNSFEDHHSDFAKETKRNQDVIGANDIAKVPYIIANYDTVKATRTKSGIPALEFTATVKEKRIVVMCIANKKHSLTLQTMYDGKNKKNSHQLRDVQAPPFTSKPRLNQSSFESSIPKKDRKSSDDFFDQKHERTSDTVSSRELLANALESVVTTSNEKILLENYKGRIADLDMKQSRLTELKKQFNAMKASDFASTNEYQSERAKLRADINALTGDIDRTDARLLELEATAALKDIVTRIRKNAESNINKKYMERAKASVESRTKTEVRNQIKKISNDFNTRLSAPKARKYVPEKLVSQVSELMEIIADNSYNYEQQIEKLEKRITEAASAAEREHYIKRIETLRQYNDNTQNKIRDLKDMYDRYRGDSHYDYYDETTAELIKDLSLRFEGKNLYTMSLDDLKYVKNTLEAVKHTMVNAVNIIDNNVSGTNAFGNRTTHEVGRSMTRAVMESRRSRPVADLFTKNSVAQSWINDTLRVSNFFNRISGFAKDNDVVKVYEMLNEGQTNKLKYMQGAYAIFNDILSGAENQKNAKALMDTKNLVTIPGLKDEKGNEVKVTRGMMLSIYMHLLNQDNRKHIMYGGMTLPDIKKYYGGQIKESLSDVGTRTIRGTNRDLFEIGKMINDTALTDMQREGLYVKYKEKLEDGNKALDKIQEYIFSQLTDWEKSYIKAAKNYFDVYSKNAINKTTMALNGFEKARVDNYFPIHSDRRFIIGETNEGIKVDKSLEHAGFLKDRVFSGNVMYLEDISNVIIGQIDSVSDYVGMAIPMRNYNKMKKAIESDNGVDNNFIASVGKVWGAQAAEYLKNFEQDLVGARTNSDRASFLDAIRGNLAGATLTWNPRVIIGQAASYNMIASVLGWDATMKALAHGGVNNTVISKADREQIAEWTPLLWYRNQGNSTTELGDLNNTVTAYGKAKDYLQSHKATKLIGESLDLIQKMDTATVGRIWYAAQYYVQDMGEFTVGSDSYWNEVAKWFNKAVEETQPNYTTLQRPEILRNKNQLVKFVTMYKTQSLQNYNVLYDSLCRWNNYRLDFKEGKNGVTAADVARARKGAIDSISAVGVSNAVYVTMRFLAGTLIANGLANFRDDDKELTFESIVKGLGAEYVDAALGMVLWGDYAYDVIKYITEGKTYSGLNISVFDEVDTLANRINALTKALEDGEPNMKDVEKAWYLTAEALKIAGFPSLNADKLVRGTINNIKDIVNGTTFEQGIERSYAQNVRIYYRAFRDKDTEKMSRIMGQFENLTTAKSQFTKYFKQLLFEEGESEIEVRKAMHATGLYNSADEIIDTVNKWKKDEANKTKEE